MKSLQWLIPALSLTVAACGPSTLAKSDRYQMEMTLHKTRADLEEVKHDLHSHRMETQILEGKVVNQEDAMASLKKETYDQHQTKLELFTHQITSVEKRLHELETAQDALLQGQQKLTKTAQEMHQAIAQGKEKINEMERNLAVATKSIGEVSKLKKNVERIGQALRENAFELMVESYRVKTHDTLESIAKNNHTNVETLCKINRLDSDKILAGQELLIPLAAPTK